MLRSIDNILNKVTMYRLVLYVLIGLLAIAGIFGALGLMPYQPLYLAYSVAVIFLISWLTNRIFARMFDAPANYESTWLTALILALIITPPSNLFDTQFLWLALWASTWAIASKYIFAIGKKHLFNPAAFGVAVTGFVLALPASWWVGTLAMAPFALVGGLLVVRKIHRFDLWWAFALTFLGGQVMFAVTQGHSLSQALSQSVLYAPAIFLSTIMLTEPLTTPPTRMLRVIYGALVGALLLPDIHIGVVYLTPELALLVGNLFAYLVSPKSKLVLALKDIRQLSPDVYEFAFARGSFAFRPGQYMEWTLPHSRADARGMRRYFTIASSPTEEEIRLGVKFYDPSSTYKRRMLSMRRGEEIVASQLSGDFTLPRDTRKELVFIAGGIGSTPFRSMIQYLIDRGERRTVTLIYQNKTPADAVYKEVFDRARLKLGMSYVDLFGRLDEETVRKLVPRYMTSTFYLSGPQGMVTTYKELLRSMGVSRLNIKTDYFPGF